MGKLRSILLTPRFSEVFRCHSRVSSPSPPLEERAGERRRCNSMTFASTHGPSRYPQAMKLTIFNFHLTLDIAVRFDHYQKLRNTQHSIRYRAIPRPSKTRSVWSAAYSAALLVCSLLTPSLGPAAEESPLQWPLPNRENRP